MEAVWTAIVSDALGYAVAFFGDLLPVIILIAGLLLVFMIIARVREVWF